MDYKIKTYQEKFLEEKVALGTSVTSHWLYWGINTVEGFKQAYSVPDFDPETRLYAFKGDKLVGYVLSRVTGENADGVIQADISYPLVLPDHKEAFDLLFDEVIKVLQKKGVKVVRTQGHPRWDDVTKVLKKRGYKLAESAYVLYNLAVDSFKIDENLNLDNCVPYTHEKDCEPMIKLFGKYYGYDEERARVNFEGIKNAEPDIILAHFLAKEDDQIVARVLSTRVNDETGTISIHVYSNNIEDDSKNGYTKALLTKAVQIAKEKGIKNLNVYLNELALKYEPIYKKLGFSSEGKISWYRKEI